MIKQAIKTEVNPVQSEEIQRMILALGGCWMGGCKRVLYRNHPYLYIFSNLTMLCGTKAFNGADIYQQNPAKEIPAGELIKMLENGLIKSPLVSRPSLDELCRFDKVDKFGNVSVVRKSI